jgi:transcriptional regulator with XRE-family HTH domain
MSLYAPRIRAARLYKDLTQAELADALGVDEKTIIRRENGKQDPKKGELIALAGICGVPVSFMQDGFGEPTRDELVEQLDLIEAKLDALLDHFDVATPAETPEHVAEEAGQQRGGTPPTAAPSAPQRKRKGQAA